MVGKAAEDEAVAIARLVTARIAPAELDNFVEDVEDYRADPRAAIKPAGRALGVGIDLFGAVLVAVVLYMADKVVDYASGRLLERAERSIRKQRQETGELPEFTPSQQARIRKIIEDCGDELGLPDDTTRQLADAFVEAVSPGGQ